LDAKTKLSVGYTDYCPVCTNTYAAALREIGIVGMTAKHTGNMSESLTRIRQTLFKVQAAQKDFYSVLAELSTAKANTEMVKQFVDSMLPNDRTGGELRQNSRRANRRDELSEAIIATMAETNHAGDPTLYELWAAATHMTSRKKFDKDPNGERSFEYVMSGPGSTFNQRAYNWAREAFGKM
jgi:hypothetical protein